MNLGYAIDDSDLGREQRISAATLPWSDTLSSTLGDAWVHNPSVELRDMTDVFLANAPWARAPVRAAQDVAGAIPLIGPAIQGLGSPPPDDAGDADRFIDPATLNKLYGKTLGLSFDTPQRKGAVDIIVAQAREQRQRDYILAHGPTGFGARTANFLTSLAVAATDPLNVGASFVPVVGEARAGLWIERYGQTLGRLGRGAVEGAVGAAGLQPIEGSRDYVFQQEYGATDAFLNIAFGSVLGGGLHAGFGKISDFLDRYRPETREAALSAAVGQAAEGRQVDVAPVLESETPATSPKAGAPAGQPVTERATPAPAVPTPTPDDIAAAHADVMTARSAAPNEPSLLDAVVKRGGIRTRKFSGDVLQEAGDIAEAFKDFKRPGLINNKTGLTPDKMREALTEQGWLGNGNRDVSATDMNDLLDPLRAEAQGQKVYHPESTIHQDLAYRQLLNRELDEAGVKKTDKPDVAAKKLAEYRASQGGADMVAAHENSDISGLLPEDYGVLQSHGYEPGADYGAEFDVGAEQGQPGGNGQGAQGSSALQGRPGENAQAAGQAGGGGQASPEFNAALDHARSASQDFTRGKEPSPVSSPAASAAADAEVKAGVGDDIDAEYENVQKQVAEYERQGILTAAEAEAARGTEDLEAAKSDSEAAQAASRCLLLHP